MPSLSPNIYFVIEKNKKLEIFFVFVFVCKCCVWRLFYQVAQLLGSPTFILFKSNPLFVPFELGCLYMQGCRFQTMSEVSSYYTNSSQHPCDMDQCVVRPSLKLHNFGKRFYGCRHWKPVSIECAYYCFPSMVKTIMLLNSCTCQLC